MASTVPCVADVPFRYVSSDEDSGRWVDFPFRVGDIVVSTRSKSGTTWMQMICALLVFGRPELPEPLGRLSPWVDHLVESREALVGRLERQSWRRILKTHTPLDGIPLDPRADYLVVARHPLDMAVSLHHQGHNIDRQRLAQLTGSSEPITRSGTHLGSSQMDTTRAPRSCAESSAAISACVGYVLTGCQPAMTMVSAARMAVSEWATSIPTPDRVASRPARSAQTLKL